MRTRSWLAILPILWVALLAGAILVGAQEEALDLDIPGLDIDLPATPPAAVASPEVYEETTTLLGLIQSGGWAMWPLGAFSIAVLALAVYHALILRRAEFCPPRLVTALRDEMAAFRVRSAVEQAGQSPTYLGRLLVRALPVLDPDDLETLGRPQVQEAMGEFAARVNGLYMLRINYFSILAQAAPMLGLLGTVSGMIKAFSVMGREGMGDPSRLAGHISEALVTTASGLIIALPALFFYFFFRNRLVQLVGECAETTEDLLSLALAAVNPDRRLDHLPNGLDRA